MEFAGGMFPEQARIELNKLNSNLAELNKVINKSSESSNNLQKRLVFWTKVMAGAIIVQVLVIIITTFFR